MTVIAAGLTSFYSWRLIFKTFHGEPHDQEHYEAAHESPMWMLIPIGVLAAGSILAGFPFKELFAGHGVEEILPRVAEDASAHHRGRWKTSRRRRLLPTLMDGERGFRGGMVVELYGIGQAAADGDDGARLLVSWLFYIRRPYMPVELARQHQMLYRFLLNKWYFDELYDLIFVRPTKWLGRFLWKVGDGYIIDGFGPDGVSARVLDVTRNVVKLQTGYLYHYAFAMLIGVAGLITWFMFGVGGQ